jgi:hypothetical protein
MERNKKNIIGFTWYPMYKSNLRIHKMRSSNFRRYKAINHYLNKFVYIATGIE